MVDHRNGDANVANMAFEDSRDKIQQCMCVPIPLKMLLITASDGRPAAGHVQ